MGLSRILAAVFAAGALLPVVACGQATGLSDDYTFDLADGSAPSADAGDAGRDAAADAGATGTDGGSATCKAAAADDLAREGAGSALCRACAADKCCSPVLACLNGAGNTNCRNTLKCVLACSTENGRAACIAKCDGVQAAAFTEVRTCLQQGCSQPCL